MLKRIRKATKSIVAYIAILSLLVPSLSFVTINTSSEAHAAGSFTVSSQAEFEAGTITSDLDTTSSSGDLKIAPSLNEQVDDVEEDFEKGAVTDTVVGASDITLFQGLPESYEYTTTSSPALNNPSVYVQQSRIYNTPLGSQYILFATGDGSNAGGISIVNTNGTFSDQSDDTLECALIDGADTPGANEQAILLNRLPTRIIIDEPNNLLYIGNLNFPIDGGISVIQMNDPEDPCDLTLLDTYTETDGSVGARVAEGIEDMYLDEASDVLYVSDRTAANSGLTAINRAGTPGDLSDDTSMRLRFGGVDDTNAAISGTNLSATPTLNSSFSWTYQIDIDEANDIIYLPTNDEFVFLDRNGTPDDFTDDTQYEYSTTTTPALPSNITRTVTVDETDNKVFIGYGPVGSAAAITEIDRGLDPFDVSGQTMTHFNTATHGDLAHPQSSELFYDTSTNILYISNRERVVLLDADTDSIQTFYDTATSPDLPYDDTLNLEVDLSENALVVSAFGGATIINLDPEYSATGTFESRPVDVSSEIDKFINWDEVSTGDHSVDIESRVAPSSSFTVDEFDDNSTANVGNEPFFAGGVFGSITESGGILTGTDPTGCTIQRCYINIDTPHLFPIGTKIKAKVRMTSGTASGGVGLVPRSGSSYEFPSTVSMNPNEWNIIEYEVTTYNNIDTLTLQAHWDTGTAGASDTLDIDWIALESPDGWSGWTPESKASLTASDESTSDWIQYRAILATATSVSTPTLNSVTLSDGYPSPVTYESAVHDSGSTSTDWTDLSFVSTEPAGTDIQFYTRTGNTATPDGSWSAWEAVNSPIASPDGQYFQFRADMSTTDILATPTLGSVDVSYSSTGTASDAQSSIAASPKSIEANGAATSAITVTVRDAGTNPLPGQTVVINTTAGTLSSVTDNGDGSYSATLTASNTAETATLSFTVNAVPFSDTDTVEFTAASGEDEGGGSTDTATIDPQSKVSDQDITVTITPKKGSDSEIKTIRYTDDGSDVTASAKVYAGPFTISKKGTTTIKWKAYSSSEQILDQGQENYYLPNTTITPTCHYPDTKQCYGPQTFNFTTAESDEEILYTINNTDPITDGIVAVEEEIAVEEFLANALTLTENKTVAIEKNTKIRFASRNRFGQLSAVYYRDSVLNYPHVLTMPDPGANAHVLGFRHDGKRIVAPNTIIEQFAKNGGSMTTGDLNGDGRDEIILSPGKGKTADLYVFSYHEEQQLGKNQTEQKELELLAFKKNVYGDTNLRTGLNIATADLNGDGTYEVITVPKEGAKSHILAFTYDMEEKENAPNRKFLRQTTDANFYAYGFEGDYTNNYTSGVEVIGVDVDGDGKDEIITSSKTGQIRIFDKYGKRHFTLGFHPHGKNARMELDIDKADMNHDGTEEIIAVPKTGTAHILFLDRYGNKVFTPNFVANVSDDLEHRIEIADMDFDGKAEIIMQDIDQDKKPLLRIFDPETKQPKDYTIKPNYPGYSGNITFSTGKWSGRYSN